MSEHEGSPMTLDTYRALEAERDRTLHQRDYARALARWYKQWGEGMAMLVGPDAALNAMPGPPIPAPPREADDGWRPWR
jgi:hypothetical protein